MRYMLVAVACTIGLAGCMAPERSRDTLEKSGFADIKVGGYDFFSCGEHDWWSTHFRARNSRGVVVEGTVCCGFLKSCTVRF